LIVLDARQFQRDQSITKIIRRWTNCSIYRIRHRQQIDGFHSSHSWFSHAGLQDILNFRYKYPWNSDIVSNNDSSKSHTSHSSIHSIRNSMDRDEQTRSLNSHHQRQCWWISA
jgi:hypothetical protein